MINSIQGRAILDKRGALRQGGMGSMDWFLVGIDPLLIYLDKRLSGILVKSLPVLGPSRENETFPLDPVDERFKQGQR